MLVGCTEAELVRRLTEQDGSGSMSRIRHITKQGLPWSAIPVRLSMVESGMDSQHVSLHLGQIFLH